MTLYEAWHGKKLDVRFLCVFGCIGHVKATRPHLQKLDDRSYPMVFIGYEIGSKAYRLFDPSTKRVNVSRDVIFDEGVWWNWEAPEEPPASSVFTIEHHVYITHSVARECDATGSNIVASAPATHISISMATTPSPARGEGTAASFMGGASQRFVIPQMTQSALFDAEDSAAVPHRFCLITDLVGTPTGKP
jgi:hypothetical protein